MKFVVYRASAFDSNEPLCEGAKREIIECENGKRNLWTIEINTIEELLNLINQEKTELIYYGAVINTKEIDGYTGYPTITFYDDYLD